MKMRELQNLGIPKGEPTKLAYDPNPRILGGDIIAVRQDRLIWGIEIVEK